MEQILLGLDFKSVLIECGFSFFSRFRKIKVKSDQPADMSGQKTGIKTFSRRLIQIISPI